MLGAVPAGSFPVQPAVIAAGFVPIDFGTSQCVVTFQELQPIIIVLDVLVEALPKSPTQFAQCQRSLALLFWVQRTQPTCHSVQPTQPIIQVG